MKPRIVGTLTALDALEEQWNSLAARTSASYFSSFEYVRTAWSHLREPTDRLLILVVSDGPTVVGIAPLCISRERRLGVPCRVIKFIAMWEGDRPQVLADGGVEQVWMSILSFLWDEHRAWEVLDLREQLAEGPAGRGWSFLQRPGRRWERSADAVGYYKEGRSGVSANAATTPSSVCPGPATWRWASSGSWLSSSRGGRQTPASGWRRTIRYPGLVKAT